MSGPTDSCMSSLFKCSLTWFSFTEGKSSLFQIFPFVSEVSDFWRVIFLVKNKEGRRWVHLGLFHVICHQFPCAIQQQAHLFPTPPFCYLGTCRIPFLLPFTCLTRFNSRSALVFLNRIPVRLGSISTFLLSHLLLLQHYVLPLYVCIQFGTPCSSVQASCHFGFISYSLGWSFLEHSSLLDPSSLWDHIPLDTSKQISEEDAFCTPEIQDCGPTFLNHSLLLGSSTPQSHGHCSPDCLQISCLQTALPCS